GGERDERSGRMGGRDGTVAAHRKRDGNAPAVRRGIAALASSGVRPSICWTRFRRGPSSHVSAGWSMTFLEEMKRRRVFRALLSYGVGAFAVLQIVEPVLHAYHWRDSLLTYVVTALAAGFPVTIALAWIYDVRNGSVQRTPDAPDARMHGAGLAAALVGIGILCATPGILWYLVLQPRAPGAAQISAAVLPFENLSGDAESEVFSDGMTEELMNALAQLPRLHVAARMSSFTFKGKRASISEVGEKLGVTHVIEGTVRKSQGRVRVTARLEEVASGTQLWSGTYEEALSDV